MGEVDLTRIAAAASSTLNVRAEARRTPGWSHAEGDMELEWIASTLFGAALLIYISRAVIKSIRKPKYEACLREQERERELSMAQVREMLNDSSSTPAGTNEHQKNE
jgi:hypothetical protein